MRGVREQTDVAVVRGVPVPRDKATSAALLGEQHVVESGPMYFLERRYPKKRCK